MDSFSFDDGKGFKVKRDEPLYAIIDTGMSFAMIPKQDFDTIVDYLNEDYKLGLYKHRRYPYLFVDCSNSKKCDKLPSINVNLLVDNNGTQEYKNFKIDKSMYLLQNTILSNQYVFAFSPFNG